MTSPLRDDATRDHRVVAERWEGILQAGHRKVLGVQEAPRPLAQCRPARPAPGEEGADVLDRVPYVQARPNCLGRWQRQTHRPAVSDQRQVDSAKLQMTVACSQPRVALDELQLAVTRVPLELHVADAAKPHGLEEPQPDPRRVGVGAVGGVARRAEPGRKLAELVPIEMKERRAVLVEVGVVGAEGVLGARDDLRRHHRHSQPRQRVALAPQLVLVADHDRLGPRTPAREEVRVNRLERQRELKALRKRREIARVLEDVGAWCGHAVLARQRVRPALVEHGQHDLVVGLDRQVPERLQLRAVPGDELQGLVVARQEHALVRAGREAFQHLLLQGRAFQQGVVAHVPRPARGAPRGPQRVDGHAAPAEAPRGRHRVRRAAEDEQGRPG
jgi:hypothetical protein